MLHQGPPLDWHERTALGLTARPEELWESGGSLPVSQEWIYEYHPISGDTVQPTGDMT